MDSYSHVRSNLWRGVKKAEVCWPIKRWSPINGRSPVGSVCIANSRRFETSLVKNAYRLEENAKARTVYWKDMYYTAPGTTTQVIDRRRSYGCKVTHSALRQWPRHVWRSFEWSKCVDVEMDEQAVNAALVKGLH